MQTVVRSNQQLVHELRTTQQPWVDAAIVVAFEDRFELVGEDHPDPMGRLNSLQVQGGFAIGLAGLQPEGHWDQGVFSTQVFREYADQAWAHQYMDRLRGILRIHSGK